MVIVYCAAAINVWAIVARGRHECPELREWPCGIKQNLSLHYVCHVTVTISSFEGRNLSAVPLFVKASSQTDRAWHAFPFPSGTALHPISSLSAQLLKGYFLWEVVVCRDVPVHTHMHRKMCSPKEETTLSANYLISAIIVLFKPQQSTHTCLIKSLLKRNIVLFLPTGPPTPWYHYNYCQILLLQEGTNCIDLSLIWQWPI